MNNLDKSQDVDKTAAFTALCSSRALRWRLGEWDWIGDAVDVLQAWAKSHGLIEAIGQDEIQRIIAQAFA